MQIKKTRQIKIWTLICHALIVIGMGHGIATLGLLEIFGLPIVFKSGFSLSLNSAFENRLPMFFLSTIVGQTLIIFSIFVKHAPQKSLTHIVGLILLWIGIIYFAFDTRHTNGQDVYFAYVTAVPFGILTIDTFLGHSIKFMYDKIIDI